MNYVQNELLYFVFNNFKQFENEEFLLNIVSFYTIEDINAAKQQILADAEAANLEYPKNTKVSTKKKEKFLDIISIVNFILINKFNDKIPCYVSVDGSKVPTYAIMLQFNFNSVYTKLQQMEAKINSFATILANVNAYNVHMFGGLTERMNNETASDLNNMRTTNVQQQIKPAKVHLREPLLIGNKITSSVNNKVLWSDCLRSLPSTPSNKAEMVSESETENVEMPFTIVERSKKRPRTNTDADNKNSNSKIKINTNIVHGSKISENSKIKGFKPIVKSVFFVKNLVKCSKNDLTEELSANNIQVFSCYPVHFPKKLVEHKQEEHENDDHSTAFRVCINKDDIAKMRNPEIWPSQVVVRDWISKERQTKNQTSINNQ